jgi:hypothetical protein
MTEHNQDWKKLVEFGDQGLEEGLICIFRTVGYNISIRLRANEYRGALHNVGIILYRVENGALRIKTEGECSVFFEMPNYFGARSGKEYKRTEIIPDRGLLEKGMTEDKLLFLLHCDPLDRDFGKTMEDFVEIPTVACTLARFEEIKAHLGQIKVEIDSMIDTVDAVAKGQQIAFKNSVTHPRRFTRLVLPRLTGDEPR